MLSPTMLSPGIALYTTAEYPCSYLENRLARSEIATAIATEIPTQIAAQNSIAPNTEAELHPQPLDHYSTLAAHGFRRSGHMVYRPACEHCQACQALRIPVAEFRPTRSQKRAWAQHQNLQIGIEAPTYQEEHYQLYCRYQALRHPGSDMGQSSRQDYIEFLLHSHVPTQLITLRDPHTQQLLSVAIIDHLKDGLSAVYTYYAPENPRHNLGSYNILLQIAITRQLNRPHLYLGYWIEHSKKMHYKTQYRPYETYQNGHWSRKIPT